MFLTFKSAKTKNKSDKINGFHTSSLKWLSSTHPHKFFEKQDIVTDITHFLLTIKFSILTKKGQKKLYLTRMIHNDLNIKWK